MASSFGRTPDCQADGAQQRCRVAGGYAARAATVVTDDEPAAGCDRPGKQPAEIRVEVLQWDLVDQSVDIAEALRRLPVPGVADEEVIGQVRLAPTGQLDEARTLVKPVRDKRDAPLPPPRDETLQQIPVRAASIEQLPVCRDGLQDRLALRAPALRSPVKSGLLGGIAVVQVRFLERLQLREECRG